MYTQKTGNLVARNIPRFVGFGGMAGAAVLAIVVMIPEFQRDPSTPPAYYLLPVIIWGAFLEALLVSGAELSRSRFIVWTDAFAPPFRRARAGAPRLPSVVRFGTVERVVPGTRLVERREQVSGISVEIQGGERVLVRESDVGTEGVEALFRAWSEWKKSEPGVSPLGSATRTPSWVEREWREEAAIGFGLIAILLLAALLIVLAGNSNTAGRVAFAALFVSGFAFAVGWILSARSRKRRIIKMREDRPRPES
ncbi:MAG TPA: hypothetical protein VEO18_06255 [Thermoplasmata archaeon]|nr:hypothetical protein [Thermoplasmata archaeon]